jgi:hypothetical protein
MSRRDARLLQSDSHVIAAIRDDGARNGAATAREVAASQGLDGSRGRATAQIFSPVAIQPVAVFDDASR